MAAQSGRNAVRVAQLRADPLEQPAREPATENIGHHFERRIVLVAEVAAEVAHVEKRLRHVALSATKTPGAGLAVTFGNAGTGGCLQDPIGEELVELCFHLRAGEIAVNREHDVGREVVALVESNQIVALDVIEIVVLDLPAVGNSARR